MSEAMIPHLVMPSLLSKLFQHSLVVTSNSKPKSYTLCKLQYSNPKNLERKAIMSKMRHHRMLPAKKWKPNFKPKMQMSITGTLKVNRHRTAIKML